MNNIHIAKLLHEYSQTGRRKRSIMETSQKTAYIPWLMIMKIQTKPGIAPPSLHTHESL
jgi:hypothetical protein